MLRRYGWFLLLSAASGLLSCATLSPPPQPSPSQPYARIVLPRAIHLLGLDTQTFDQRVYVYDMRVTPGPHSLRMAYEGTSVAHRGQSAVTFLLETRAGHQYDFEAKTCGISWRPAVAEHTLIAGYCTTHACTAEERSTPPRIPRTPKCNID
jgi:hypothetical protein